MATDWERACFALAETLYHHSGLQDEFADRFLALVEKWPPKEEGPGPRPDPADGDAGGGPGAGPSSKPGAGPFGSSQGDVFDTGAKDTADAKAKAGPPNSSEAKQGTQMKQGMFQRRTKSAAQRASELDQAGLLRKRENPYTLSWLGGNPVAKESSDARVNRS